MKSDPVDALAPILLWKATAPKMEQSLFRAAICSVVAIPIAAGVLYPAFGLLPRPEFGALAMSASRITVVTNAPLLRRELPAPRSRPPCPWWARRTRQAHRDAPAPGQPHHSATAALRRGHGYA